MVKVEIKIPMNLSMGVGCWWSKTQYRSTDRDPGNNLWRIRKKRKREELLFYDLRSCSFAARVNEEKRRQRHVSRSYLHAPRIVSAAAEAFFLLLFPSRWTNISSLEEGMELPTYLSFPSDVAQPGKERWM